MDDALIKAINAISPAPSSDCLHQRGWVLASLRNALWQLLYAPNLEEGVVGTVMCGKKRALDAAVAGALLGAVNGTDAIPAQWIEKLLSCHRPPDYHR